MIAPAGRMPVVPACPVCAASIPPPDGADQYCAHCGWFLRGPLRLGLVDEDEIRHSAQALRDGQRQWDVAAATRAGRGHGPAPAVTLGRLLALVRGGVPAVPPGFDSEPEPAAETVSLDAVVAGLRHTGAHAALSILEVGVAALTLWHARAGTPELAIAWSRRWPEICHGVSADPDVRRFQLAGGVGSGAVVDRPGWDRALADALTQIAAAATGPVLLVAPPVGWHLLERAAAAAQARLHPAGVLPAGSDLPQLGRLAETAMSRVPVPEILDVVLARYDSARDAFVAERRQVLAGTAAAREEELVVYGPPDGGEVLLPVIARGTPGRTAAAVRLTLDANERAVVRARYETSGAVRLEHPAALAEPRPWERFAERLPDLLRPAGKHAVDVLVTVELGGPEDAVARRIADARRIFTALGHAASGALSVHTGVVGYGDHWPGRPVGLTVHPLAPVETGLSRLGDLRAARPYDDLLAPLEEALCAALDTPWRPGSRRLVLMLAERPPHPVRLRGRLSRCDLEHDAAALAALLRGGPGAHLAALVSPAQRAGTPDAAAREYAASTWPALCDAGPFDTVDVCLNALRDLLRPPEHLERLRLALAAPVPQ